MEPEESFRLILKDVVPESDIQKRLRNVPLKNYKNRFEIVALELIKEQKHQTTKIASDSDFQHLRNILTSVSDEAIHEVLSDLPLIPNRLYIALSLLLHKRKKQQEGHNRKRKFEENGEKSNSLPSKKIYENENITISCSESSSLDSEPKINVSTNEIDNVSETYSPDSEATLRYSVEIMDELSPSLFYDAKEDLPKDNIEQNNAQDQLHTGVKEAHSEESTKKIENTLEKANNNNYIGSSKPCSDDLPWSNTNGCSEPISPSDPSIKITISRVRDGSSLPSFKVKQKLDNLRDHPKTSANHEEDDRYQDLTEISISDNVNSLTIAKNEQTDQKIEKQELMLLTTGSEGTNANQDKRINKNGTYDRQQQNEEITNEIPKEKISLPINGSEESSANQDKRINENGTNDRQQQNEEIKILAKIDLTEKNQIRSRSTLNILDRLQTATPLNVACDQLYYNDPFNIHNQPLFNSKQADEENKKRKEAPTAVMKPPFATVTFGCPTELNDSTKNEFQKALSDKKKKKKDIPATITKKSKSPVQPIVLDDSDLVIDDETIVINDSVKEIVDGFIEANANISNGAVIDLSETLAEGNVRVVANETVIDLVGTAAHNNGNVPLQFDPNVPSTSAATTTYSAPVAQQIDEKLFHKVLELFPDTCPDYIRTLCANQTWSEQVFDQIIETLFSQPDHPQRVEKASSPEEINPEDQVRILEEMLTDCDPTYLRVMVDKYSNDQARLQNFIDDVLNKKIEYPTRKEYLKKQQISAQQKQYTTEFKLEKFIEIFADPQKTFEDPERKPIALDAYDSLYLKNFLRNMYRRLAVRTIDNCLKNSRDKGLLAITKFLDREVAKGNLLKSLRYITPYNGTIQNIPLLQELAYYEHKQEILAYMENKKRQEEKAREDARKMGLLQECQCCFDNEVMPNDVFECQQGCRFCKDCMVSATEVKLGDGKVDFPCLRDCGAEFTIVTLQNALPPKMFSILGQKKAAADIAAAGIEDLETCPFCEFASIPAPGDKLFRCLNPECMKESCRKCKEPSHVPLRCEEVEKDEHVKARTAIENKMTEALIRECWKCKNKFIKTEGCNKMTCACGAMMCYVCRKPVTDYKHFNGDGGTRTDLCPLYSDNFSVNEKNVLKAAEEAKKEVGITNLKLDPTKDLDNHFSKSKQQHEIHVQRQLDIARANERLLQQQQNRVEHRLQDLNAALQRINRQRERLHRRYPQEVPLPGAPPPAPAAHHHYDPLLAPLVQHPAAQINAPPNPANPPRHHRNRLDANAEINQIIQGFERYQNYLDNRQQHDPRRHRH